MPGYRGGKRNTRVSQKNTLANGFSRGVFAHLNRLEFRAFPHRLKNTRVNLNCTPV